MTRPTGISAGNRLRPPDVTTTSPASTTASARTPASITKKPDRPPPRASPSSWDPTSRTPTRNSGWTASWTTERARSTDSKRPTRPAPVTTGIPSAKPSSLPLSTSIVWVEKFPGGVPKMRTTTVSSSAKSIPTSPRRRSSSSPSASAANRRPRIRANSSASRSFSARSSS